LIKPVFVAAGLLAATLPAGQAAAQSAPDCKAAWGNAACPPAKTAAAAPNAQITPKPRPEPGAAQGPGKPPARKPAKPGNPAPPHRAAKASLGPRPNPGSGQDWRRYREWFGRYAAWYYAYGRYDGAGGPERMDNGPIRRDVPPENSRPGPTPALEDRARLDPWHGYDSRDGLGNGY
jgi:hypothetical protein